MANIRDVWSEAIYPASFGTLPLDVRVTTDEFQRSLAKLEYPRKDGADVQPMGNGPRRTRLQVCFFEREPDEDDALDGDDDHLTRATRFVATALGATKPLTFVHPLFGEFEAWCEDLEVQANGDDRNYITVECSFVEDSTSPSVLMSAELSPNQTSTGDVNVLANAYQDQLDASGFELPADSAGRTLRDDVATKTDTWETDPDLGTRDINGDLQQLADEIDDTCNDIDYATSLDRFPIFRTLARLHGSLTRAAEQFKKLQPQRGTYIVPVGQPLRAIVINLYGASEWEVRWSEMLRLNDIPDPGYIPAGTTLVYVLPNPVGISVPRGLRGKASL